SAPYETRGGARAVAGKWSDLVPPSVHKTPHVRANVGLGLARAATPDARKALATLAKDASALVRAAAGRDGPHRGDDWIRLTVKDRTGAPRRHKLYVMVLPDGLAKAGYTDARGVAAGGQVVPASADSDVVEEEPR